jgi:tRNA pseudouridine55 synthase
MPADPPSPSGLLLIDKPTGPTSHDVVAVVQKILAGTKAGHLGTLDPLASGLLVILTGNATKLAPFVKGDPKRYEGTILLGVSTDSMDTDGSVMSRTSCQVEGSEVAEVLLSLQGEMEQVPPAYSAVKVDGKPAYKYARSGRELEIRPRRVTVYGAEMTAFRKGEGTAEFDFTLSCSPGFYVRAYASTIGDKLSCGGALARLRRLASGPFRVDRALTLDALQAEADRAQLKMGPALEALQGLKRVAVADAWLEHVKNGISLDSSMIEKSEGEPIEGEVIAVVGPEGKLLGVHEVLTTEPFRSKARRMM